MGALQNPVREPPGESKGTRHYGVGIFHGVFSGIDKMFAEGKKTDPSFIQLAPERASKYLYKTSTICLPAQLTYTFTW